jgi:hypothetical protein
MQTITEIALERAERGIFTRNQAALWVGSQGARLDALLKRAVASHEVWRVHKTLYCLSERFLHFKINPLELAQRIHGPSYISLESALSFHECIPEAVHAITSVSAARSRTFDTSVGLFSFLRVPQLRFLAGVRRVFSEEGNGAFFLATPLKALADTVYAQRLDWRSIVPIAESLRFDQAYFAKLTGTLFDEVESAYKPGRVSRFLAGLRKDLKL